MRLVMIIVMTLLFAACGGLESFTQPRIESSDITMSVCKEEGGEEKISYDVKGREVIITHENILLPEYSVIGIEDKNHIRSYESTKTYFDLSADERNIHVTETVKYGSGKMCLYDFTVRIKNISGGEYRLSVWGESDVLPESWPDVWVQ